MGWQGYQTVEAANKMVSRTFVLLEGDLSMVTLIQYIYIYRCEGLSHLAPTKGELALAIGASGQF